MTGLQADKAVHEKDEIVFKLKKEMVKVVGLESQNKLLLQENSKFKSIMRNNTESISIGYGFPLLLSTGLLGFKYLK